MLLSPSEMRVVEQFTGHKEGDEYVPDQWLPIAEVIFNDPYLPAVGLVPALGT